MPRAVIYTRVSTSDQVDNYSLETQETECAKYCSREGLEVDHIFREEGESAKTINRTALQEMLRYLTSNAKKREITHVVVYRVDRLAREVGGHHTIKTALAKLNVTLHSVMERFDETATGKLTENLMAVLAQFDNDLRSQRTKDGMKAALAHGRWMWFAPVGYLRGPTQTPSLVIDPILGPVVREIFQRTASGEPKDSVRLWAAELGVTTRDGAPLHPQGFHRLLTNPLYKGLIVLPKWGVTKEGDFEPLVDAETFRLANHTIHSGDGRSRQRSLNNPDFPLRRTVRCGACTTPLTASWSTGKGGSRYGYYTCRKKECRQVKVSKPDLEAQFEEWLGEVSLADPFFDALDAVVQDYAREAQKGTHAHLDRVQTTLDELNARETKLMDTYLAGTGITEALFTKHMKAIEDQRIELKEELSALHVDHVDFAATIEKARRLMSDLPASWNTINPLQRPVFLRFLVPDGLRYQNGAFGTPDSPSGIRGIVEFFDPKKHVALLTGFEPVSPP